MPSAAKMILVAALFVCPGTWSCDSQPGSDSSQLEDSVLADLPDDLPAETTDEISSDLPDVPSDICVLDCEGKECGSDGCGGECKWTCGLRDTCGDDFKCIPCVRDCREKFCGDDGCDGSCGECQPGWVCVNFTCPAS